MDHRLPLTSVHDALDPKLTHLGKSSLQHFNIQGPRLVADIIHRTKGAPVITSTNRGYLHVNRINLLGFFPVTCGIQQLTDPLGVINQFVTVYGVRIRHFKNLFDLLETKIKKTSVILFFSLTSLQQTQPD